MPSERKAKKAQKHYGLASKERGRAAARNDQVIRQSAKKRDRQEKVAATQAKYGRRGKPAPVTVRSLESGEVLRVEGLPTPRRRRRKPDPEIARSLAAHRRLDAETAATAARDE